MTCLAQRRAQQFDLLLPSFLFLHCQPLENGDDFFFVSAFLPIINVFLHQPWEIFKILHIHIIVTIAIVVNQLKQGKIVEVGCIQDVVLCFSFLFLLELTECCLRSQIQHMRKATHLLSTTPESVFHQQNFKCVHQGVVISGIISCNSASLGTSSKLSFPFKKITHFVCNSIAIEGGDQCLSHIPSGMGLGQLNEVEYGHHQLVMSNPRNQDIHEGLVIRWCPTVQLVGQLARVFLKHVSILRRWEIKVLPVILPLIDTPTNHTGISRLLPW